MLARSSLFATAAVRVGKTIPLIPQPQNIITPMSLINISTGGLFNQPNMTLNIVQASPKSHEDLKKEEDISLSNNRSSGY